jgi:16S rRNA (guanine1516-N2)-methyltransferase
LILDLGHARRLRPEDPLLRALGRQSGVRTVIDATAGLGRDAAALALAGLEVIAIERAPALGALWARARLPLRLSFREGDARTLLRALPPPDAVYLDPMYPEAARKSAQSKDLVMLRQLVGDDVDAPELLAIAREVASVRVVVKRPRKSPPLAPPSHSWQGASTRYDLYVRS